ncbi:MAG: CD225/dispanin family protein [Bacteroidales bacterium]|jgi:ABC-type Fe3+ transport system permease subunit|nr:CD225/dispanin family protein [Bacteroidales bacterium]
MNDQQQPQIPPPNYLVWAIIATVLCCLPFGIVSIVFAAQVNSKWAAGDFTGAQISSKNAKTWAWVSFGAGLLFAIAYLIIVFIIGIGFADIGLDSFDV